MREEIVRRAYAAFRVDSEAAPALTLRGGDALDSYASPPQYDPERDAPPTITWRRTPSGGWPTSMPLRGDTISRG